LNFKRIKSLNKSTFWRFCSLFFFASKWAPKLCVPNGPCIAKGSYGYDVVATRAPFWRYFEKRPNRQFCYYESVVVCRDFVNRFQNRVPPHLCVLNDVVQRLYNYACEEARFSRVNPARNQQQFLSISEIRNRSRSVICESRGRNHNTTRIRLKEDTPRRFGRSSILARFVVSKLFIRHLTRQ